MMCKRGRKFTSGKSQVNQVSLKDDNEDNPTIWTITGGHTEGYHVHLKLDQKPVKMELDTGAAVSVMSEQHCLQRANHSDRMRENHNGGIQDMRCT